LPPLRALCEIFHDHYRGKSPTPLPTELMLWLARRTTASEAPGSSRRESSIGAMLFQRTLADYRRRQDEIYNSDVIIYRCRHNAETSSDAIALISVSQRILARKRWKPQLDSTRIESSHEYDKDVLADTHTRGSFI